MKGEVVNIMSYGAFVKLEDGIEGLVHISEMSWTRRLQHPSEMVNTGEEVEVVVLGINTDKQEISLGMKQTQPNPWDDVAVKYPVGAKVKGDRPQPHQLRCLHRVGRGGRRPLARQRHELDSQDLPCLRDCSRRGTRVECQVISVDENRKRIALGLKQLDEDPWETTIPQKYAPGAIVKGNVTKITNFGVFVQLEDELEGLLHISELAAHKVDDPEAEVQVGQELEVRVLRVDPVDRKIGLSRKLEGEIEPEEGAEAGAVPGAKEPLKGGMGDTSGPALLDGRWWRRCRCGHRCHRRGSHRVVIGFRDWPDFSAPDNFCPGRCRFHHRCESPWPRWTCILVPSGRQLRECPCQRTLRRLTRLETASAR